MSEPASADTSAKRERADPEVPGDSLTRDMANPAMYAVAPFPRPKKAAATLAPTVLEEASESKTDSVTEDIKQGRNDAAVIGDDELSRRGRASQALAEMKNAAQQRGLLKSTGDLDDDGAPLSENAEPSSTSLEENVSELLPAAAIARGKKPTKQAEAVSSDLSEATVTEGNDDDSGKVSPEQIDDASRRQRLVVLADWLTDSIGMSDVFLIDTRGYSLLPEESDASDSAAATALHDLGLRLGGVLDLAGRRLPGESSGDENEKKSENTGRVARLTLDSERCLAVAKVAMTQNAERPLLGWVEPLRTPLADSWVESACDYAADVLARDFGS